MVRLASLASCALRNTCIKGGLRRDGLFAFRMRSFASGRWPSPTKLIGNSEAAPCQSRIEHSKPGRVEPMASTRHCSVRAWPSLQFFVALQVPAEADVSGRVAFIALGQVLRLHLHEMNAARF